VYMVIQYDLLYNPHVHDSDYLNKHNRKQDTHIKIEKRRTAKEEENNNTKSNNTNYLD